MKRKAFFIASTGQHVGKTTTCLGLLAKLREEFDSVGFMKPVGQEHVEVGGGISVDKDVNLFKEHFGLEDDYEMMSPILIPRGFTRRYLDGEVKDRPMIKKIKSSFAEISGRNQCTVVEGTGHVGVGTIVNLSNAKVASLLGLDMILVASGGLGSSFDALAVNKALCDIEGVKIAGVIINRVLEEKREMIETYMTKALKRWDIPLLGCIPFDPFLMAPSMKDFESLFKTTLLTGQERQLRHFRHTRLIASSVETYTKLIVPRQLVITPAVREDIILATLTKHWDVKVNNHTDDIKSGMILTGDEPPKDSIIKELKKADIPMLYVPLDSYKVMKKITTFTAKIQREDQEKIQEAKDLVASHINLNILTL